MGLHQGGRLSHFIEKQGKSKEELARLSGISKGSFYSYLKMEKVPADKLEKICEVLEIDYIKEFVLSEKKDNKLTNRLNEEQAAFGLVAINEALKSENEALKAQIIMLKDMVSMLKGKKK